MNPIGEPDAGDRHVRFDERGWETGDWQSLKHRAHPRLYPSTADAADGRDGPGTDKTSSYSITSSARSRIDGGTARPSALAVLRFTTISNFVGNCTGRSPGFAPRRMRST